MLFEQLIAPTSVESKKFYLYGSKKKIELLHAHLYAFCGVTDAKEKFDFTKKQSLVYEVDNFSETINIRALNFNGLYVDVVTKIIDELQKQSDFKDIYKEFCSQCVLNLNTVRWSPDLEYQMSKILRDKEIGTVQAHALLFLTQEQKRPLSEWRRRVDMSSVNLLTNSLCKLREPRDSVWNWKPFRNVNDPSSVLVRTKERTWWKLSVDLGRSTGGTTSAFTSETYETEPDDWDQAIVFSSIPHSTSTLPACVLALKKNEISIGCFGDKKSFASFAHGVNDADFLESYLLPSNTIIVRVGKRNTLTGGLTDEDFFSFKRDGERSISPHVLDGTETTLVEEISKVDTDYPWTFTDTSSCLTGFNDLAGAQSKVIYKQSEMVLSRNLVVAVLGHPSAFFAIFYDGTVQRYQNGSLIASLKINLPITHGILKF